MVRQEQKSRLLPSIRKKLFEQFVAGVSARTAAKLTGVDRNTAILFFHKLREIIALSCRWHYAASRQKFNLS
jgi:transposase-like protein